MNPTAYPLAWPDGWPRTAARNRERSRFRTSYADGSNDAMAELNRARADALAELLKGAA